MDVFPNNGGGCSFKTQAVFLAIMLLVILLVPAFPWEAKLMGILVGLVFIGLIFYARWNHR